MVDQDTEPTWRVTFDAVVAAATDRKKKGDSLDMPSILDAAGVEQNAWSYAVRMAKEHCYDEIEAFYSDVLERKLRGSNGRPKTVAEIARDAEPSDEEVEEMVEEVTEAEILKLMIDGLGQFGDDKAGMVRTLRTVAMFFDLDLAEPRTQAIAKLTKPIKPKRSYKRRNGATARR